MQRSGVRSPCRPPNSSANGNSPIPGRAAANVLRDGNEGVSLSGRPLVGPSVGEDQRRTAGQPSLGLELACKRGESCAQGAGVDAARYLFLLTRPSNDDDVFESRIIEAGLDLSLLATAFKEPHHD